MRRFILSSFVIFLLQICSELYAETPIYLGCYEDYPYRKLIGYSYTDSSQTREKCFTTCNSKAFVYAALFKDECYCGRHPELLQKRTDDSECNYKCAGEKKKCGGNWRLSVFYLPQKCQIVENIYTKDVYLGCYQDDKYNRKLNSFNYTDSDAMSNEVCKRVCQKNNYLFAGIQKGIYCYCGNNHPLPDDKIGEDQCHYTCKGHPCNTKLCGGDMANAIYAVGQCRKTDAPKAMPEHYAGCFKDNPNNVWYEYSFKHPRMSVDYCFIQCRRRGFVYAALHSGLDCLCGNGHVLFADKVIDSECDVNCIGDNWMCGGKNTSVVYYLNQICTQVAAVQSISRKNYIGCFKDGLPRKLNGFISVARMTIELCIETCQKKGFIYAGVQFSDECFCGNEEQFLEHRKPESKCNMKCRGNKEEICGGFWKNGVYEAGECVKVKQIYDRDETFLGCFTNTNYSLLGFQFSDKGLTLDRCFMKCERKGFMYASISEAEHCQCGNNHIPFSAKVDETSCDTLCEGAYKCGGASVYNLYRVIQSCHKIKPVQSNVYLGCYFDEGIRKLNESFSPYKVTPDNCIRHCQSKGFMFAGVQFGTQCFCGNEEQLLVNRRPETDCNMKCAFDRKKMCGGFFRNGVYEAGQCTRKGARGVYRIKGQEK